MISITSLWIEVVTQKYIALDDIIDWIRKMIKIMINVSITWKAAVKYFNLIGDHLA